MLKPMDKEIFTVLRSIYLFIWTCGYDCYNYDEEGQSNDDNDDYDDTCNNIDEGGNNNDDGFNDGFNDADHDYDDNLTFDTVASLQCEESHINIRKLGFQTSYTIVYNRCVFYLQKQSDSYQIG